MIRLALWLSLLCGISCGVGRAFLGSGGEYEVSDASRSSGGSGSSTPGSVGTVPTAPTPQTVTGALIDPNAPGCAHGSISAASAPIHLIFTIDRSGSMDDSKEASQQNRPTKWAALQAALQAVLADFATAANAGNQGLALGIDYFSDGSFNDAKGSQDTQVEFPVAPVTQSYINQLSSDLKQRSAGGYTPTVAALTISYAAVQNFTPAAGSPLVGGEKVAVLVSDGLPFLKNASGPYPPTPTTIPDLVSSEASGSPAVRTFSIGVGEPGSTGLTGYDPVFMSWVAYAGGTGKPGCDPTSTDQSKYCHFQITPSVSGANIVADFVSAFADIRQQIQSCSLKLNIPDPTVLQPLATIVVAQTGSTQVVLPQDPANGWSFDNATNPTAIILNGSECATINANPSTQVFAILGCTCPQGSSGGGASTSGGVGGRDITAGSAWNTDWCSYPWASSGGGTGQPGG